MDILKETILRSLNSNAKEKTILVKFYGRDDMIEYTTNIMELLKNDKHVQDIVDPETYEVIFTNDRRERYGN